MKVAELAKTLEHQREVTPVARLGDVEMTDEGLVVKSDKTLDPIPLDEVSLSKVAKYLGINTRYLLKCPQPLQQVNVNSWLQQWSEAQAMFHIFGGGLQGIHRPDRRLISAKRLGEVIDRVFDDNDEVKELKIDSEFLHVDVISEKNKVTVPGLGTSHRPANDITHAGLRMFGYPMTERAPYLQTYLHRLVCLNGMAIDEPELQIQLKSKTVSDILNEIEEKAQMLMEGLDTRLMSYRETADVKIPGNLEQFVYHLGRERRLNTRVMDTVMSRVTELPNDPTVYDVTQAFTTVANEDVGYRARLRLQRIGGDLSSRTEEMLHRCEQCARPL